MRPVLFASLFAFGCQEYEVQSTLPAGDPSNVRPIESEAKSDRVVQRPTPLVDVLWVIDNSGSMGNDQAALADNFPVFMEYFLNSGLDYHIGVVTTDIDSPSDSGKLRSVGGELWIDPDTPDAIASFQELAVVGTNGSSTESGVGAAYVALEERANGYNAGFLREDASLHVVTISDEEDYTPDYIISASEMANYLNGLKIRDDMVTYNVVVDPVWGDEYIQISDAVGGIKRDINNNAWGDLLVELGIQAAGLKREFFLSSLPVPGTIRVSVIEEGVTQTFAEDTDWLYSEQRNSIQFIDYVPNPLAEVIIDYDDLATTEID